MYFKSKIVKTQSEAVVKLMSDHMLPYFKKFDCHKWRVDNLWNYPCENVFLKYESILSRLYKKYSGKYSMPGRQDFMSIEEFIAMFNDSNVL